MSHTLIIRPEGEQDLAGGRDWYEGRDAGLGAEFMDAVDTAFDSIRENPALHPAEFKGDTVEVIAVQHGSRNPRRWRSRA